MNGDYSELVISDSLLADIFVARYAQELPHDSLITYLWLNMMCHGKEFDEDTIKSYKILPDSDVREAIAGLMSAGIVTKKDDKFVIEDLKKREIGEYIDSMKARGDSYDTGLQSDEEEHRKLSNSISKTFFHGVMSYGYYRLIDKCLYEYKFESSVCYRLFEEGYQKDILRSFNAMSKIASTWHEKGYTTAERLDCYLEQDAMKTRIIKLCGKIMRKRMNEMDIERINRWVEDYKVNEEMVNYAFRTNEYRTSLTLKHVEDTIKKWFDAGVDNVDKAAEFEEEQHKENKRKAVRRGSRKNSPWKTGEEAGVEVNTAPDKTSSTSKNKDTTKADAKNEPLSDINDKAKDDDVIPFDILDLFGDSNEDN